MFLVVTPIQQASAGFMRLLALQLLARRLTTMTETATATTTTKASPSTIAAMLPALTPPPLPGAGHSASRSFIDADRAAKCAHWESAHGPLALKSAGGVLSLGLKNSKADGERVIGLSKARPWGPRDCWALGTERRKREKSNDGNVRESAKAIATFFFLWSQCSGDVKRAWICRREKVVAWRRIQGWDQINIEAKSMMDALFLHQWNACTLFPWISELMLLF